MKNADDDAPGHPGRTGAIVAIQDLDQDELGHDMKYVVRGALMRDGAAFLRAVQLDHRDVENLADVSALIVAHLHSEAEERF